MNHQDLRTLRLLEEIGTGEVPPSQRDLAKRLDVSLGLVNSFLKRLAQKGYFKVSTVPRNRIKYILTPKGAAEKTRLTYKFMQHSYRFYKDARQKFCKLFGQLTKEGITKVVFYGAGDVAEIAAVCLEETPIKLAAVVDDTRQGERFRGKVVKGTGDLGSISFDKILVTTAEPYRWVFKDIYKCGVHQEKIAVLE